MNLFENIDLGISQYFTDSFIGPRDLSSSELAHIEKAGEKRRSDFATGRHCAKKCLEKFGIYEAEILAGDKGEPLWPGGVVGSISHSKYLAGAVAASTDKFLSIGLDIEKTGSIKTDMWDLLYTQSEQQFLNNLPLQDMDMFCTLIFSLKESFYKYQYPLTKTFLEFKDVELTYESNKFNINIVTKGYPIALPLESIQSYWILFENQVITLCYSKIL